MTIVVKCEISGEVVCYHTCTSLSECELHIRFYNNIPDTVAFLKDST